MMPFSVRGWNVDTWTPLWPYDGRWLGLVDFEADLNYIRMAAYLTVGPVVGLTCLPTHFLQSHWGEFGPREKFAGIVELASGWGMVAIAASMTRVHKRRTAQYLTYAFFVLVAFSIFFFPCCAR